MSNSSNAYTPALPLFAQLLAQENVKVRINEHAAAASFDVHSRILTLPSWRGFDADAFNLFVVHEVGHALFTPPDWLDRQSLLDIAAKFSVTKGQVWTVMITLEDIRIERKIRAKYRGLSTTFAKGYAELLRRDFFKFGPAMTAERWAKYGICDKLNLYGKVGGLAGLSLTDPNHIAWYNEAVKAESYDEVIALAAKIIEWVKTNKKNQPKPETQDNHGAPDEKPEPKKQPKQEEKQDPTEPTEKPEEGANDEAEGDSAGEDLESEGTEPSGDDIPEPPKPGASDEEPTESDEEPKGDESEESDESGDSAGEDLEGENDEESTESGDAAGDSENEESEESEESTESGDDEDSDSGASKGDAEGDSDENGDEENDEDTDSDGDASDSDGDNRTNPTTGADTKEDSLESETKDAADEALKSAADSYTGKNPVVLPIDLSFLNISDIDLKMLTESWGAAPSARSLFAELVAKHRRDAAPILAAMVASFRQNQSASIARKTQTAKSGSIDPLRLGSYKFSEDIFLRRAITAKGQNHGFVVNVDFSGSMDDQLPTVLWQLLHLIWFAETIKVPMEVYAFNTICGNSNIHVENALNADRMNAGKYAYSPEGRSICLYSTAAPAPMKATAQSMILARIYYHANTLNSLSMVLQYSTPEAKKAVADSRTSNRYQPVPAPSVSLLSKKLSSFGDVNWWNTVELHGASRYYQLFKALPMPVREYADSIFSLSMVELTSALDIKMLELGGTPLHHALLAQAAVVRSFRERNRVEQCVSIWLTDGDDTQGVSIDDPRIVNEPTKIKNMHNNVVFVPATGKSYACETLNPAANGGRVDMPIFLEIHRDLTGAAVVMVDLNANPSKSLSRLLSPADIKELGAAIALTQADGRMVINTYVPRRGRRAFYASPRAKVMVVGQDVAKQSKKSVIIKKSKGSFSESGIVAVDRAMFPTMGADAYVIADPSAFTEGSKYAAKAAASVAAAASQSTGVDEDAVRATLTTQSAHLAMRRFSEILIPFLADSK